DHRGSECGNRRRRNRHRSVDRSDAPALGRPEGATAKGAPGSSRRVRRAALQYRGAAGRPRRLVGRSGTREPVAPLDSRVAVLGLMARTPADQEIRLTGLAAGVIRDVVDAAHREVSFPEPRDHSVREPLPFVELYERALGVHVVETVEQLLATLQGLQLVALN